MLIGVLSEQYFDVRNFKCEPSLNWLCECLFERYQLNFHEIILLYKNEGKFERIDDLLDFLVFLGLVGEAKIEDVLLITVRREGLYDWKRAEMALNILVNSRILFTQFNEESLQDNQSKSVHLSSKGKKEDDKNNSILNELLYEKILFSSFDDEQEICSFCQQEIHSEIKLFYSLPLKGLLCQKCYELKEHSSDSDLFEIVSLNESKCSN